MKPGSSKMDSGKKWRVAAVLALVSALLAMGCAGDDRGQPANRIIGGKETRPGEFPFMASIESKEGYCGGTIIDDRHILTAAHCASYNGTKRPISPEDVRVKIGCHKRSECNSTYHVAKVMAHRDYDWGYPEKGRDIAVLKLKEAMKFNNITGLNAVGPVNLAPGNDSCCDHGMAKQKLTAIGWGLTTHGQTLSDTLLKVGLNLWPLENCRKINSGLAAEFVCTKTKGKGICEGDSGGPLMKTSPGGSLIQVGITSFFRGKCDTELGGAFTKVAAFRGWIGHCISNGTCPTM